MNLTLRLTVEALRQNKSKYTWNFSLFNAKLHPHHHTRTLEQELHKVSPSLLNPSGAALEASTVRAKHLRLSKYFKCSRNLNACVGAGTIC